MYKKCIKCCNLKKLNDFSKDKSQKDGYCYRCKLCGNLRYRQLYEVNKEKLSKKKKEYIKKNKEHYLEIQRKNRANFSEERKEKNRAYLKEYRKKNKEILKKRRQEKKEQLNNYQKEYYKEKYHKNLLYTLKLNVRNLIRNSFRYNNLNKSKNTIEILGCSFIEFREHLESKFDNWMNWNNRGLYNGEENYGWDIDHIIPLSSAKTEEEVIRLNHYSNLQPLCSKINRNIKRG